MPIATTRLQNSSRELLEFIRELAKALQDKRLSIREGFRLAPELVDFVMTLKDGKEIVKEWKMLSNEAKRETALEAIISLKEQVENDIVDLRLSQLEKVVEVVEIIQDTVEIEREIQALKNT